VISIFVRPADSHVAALQACGSRSMLVLWVVLWAKPEACNPVRRQLLDALAAGTTLVVDRYAYSGVAFTAAKGVPALDLPWCKVGSPAPPAA
jgi:hypothetical protein